MKQRGINKTYRIILRAFLFALFLLIPNRARAQADSSLIKGEIITPKPTAKYYSPHKATLYSAVLPGMGQIYNKKYWKAPIVWGAMFGAGYMLFFNQKYYTEYKNAYRDYIIQDPANRSYEPLINRLHEVYGMEKSDLEYGGKNSKWFLNALNSKKMYYRQYRDYGYVAIGLVYVLNIIDAAVDAHFKQFDISDDLTIHWEPVCTPNPIYGTNFGVGVNLTFK